MMTREEKLAYKEAYRQSHKEEISVYARVYGEKLRQQVLEHYSNGTPKCACCGIDDILVLCVDHINGGGNKHRKQLHKSSGTSFCNWLIRQGYPEGFQVLCHNCNFRKTRLSRQVSKWQPLS